MSGDYRLEGWAVPEGLQDLHDVIRRVSIQQPEVSTEDLSMLETAVIEVAGNVVEHGRPSGEVRWSFALEVLPDRLRVTLTDDGAAYEGDLDEQMPGELEEAGRGLPLAGLVLDELSYQRRGEANVWTMVRHRHGEAPGQAQSR